MEEEHEEEKLLAAGQRRRALDATIAALKKERLDLDLEEGDNVEETKITTDIELVE